MTEFSAPYRVEIEDVRIAHDVFCRARTGTQQLIRSLLIGAGIAAAAWVTAGVAAGVTGATGTARSLVYYGTFLMLALGGFFWMARMNRRTLSGIAEPINESQQVIAFSAIGLSLAGEGGRTDIGWRDVDAVVEDRGVLTIISGDDFYIAPLRNFAVDFAPTVREWHAASGQRVAA